MNDRSEDIRFRILVPIVTGGILLLFLSVAGGYRLQKKAIDESVHKRIAGVQRLFRGLLSEEAQVMNGQLDFIEMDQALLDAFLAKDRQKLLQGVMPLFEEMRSKYRITHFYFSEPDKVCFLRVHSPSRYGDPIERFTMEETAASGNPSSGIELGPYGTFTLRVVRPWKMNGNLVGYLELGMGIEHITRLINRALHVELSVLIDKKFLDRGDWEEGLKILDRGGDWERFNDFVIIDRTMENSPALEELRRRSIGGDESIFSSRLGNRSFKGRFFPLFDAGGRRVGEIFSLVDVSSQQKDLVILIVSLGVLTVAIGGGLLLFFYIYIGGIQNRLVHSRAKIQAEVEERRRSEKALQASQESYRSLFEESKDAIVSTDADGRILMANAAAKEMFGLAETEIGDWDFKKFYVDTSAARKFVAAVGEHGFVRDFGVQLYGKDRSVMDCLLTVKARRSCDGTVVGYEGIIRDVSPYKRMEEELRRLATTDSLTNLDNRRNFLELTQKEINRSKRYQHPLSLVMLDIDRFKKVNDHYGHSAGDRVLKELSLVCRRQLRESDILGRLGGDEFAIALVQSEIQEAALVAERIRQAIAETSVRSGMSEVRFTISLGVTQMSLEGDDLDALLDRSDNALYAAKEAGGNRVRTAD
ncbi:MAG: diguanylate cyclase [Deltaproteobacteria bacterium]|nr:diguanylate cyclase [Deltaproteobacteria bacterium]